MTPVQAWCQPPGSVAPSPDRLAPITGIDCLNKPGRRGEPFENKGLWTSSWLGREAISDWVRWCRDETFRGPDFAVWLLEPDPSARVYEIDDCDDLDALLRSYGGPPPAPFDNLGIGMFVDFDRLGADGYAGVHLTEEGQWRTRGMGGTRPFDAPSLYGWDCESTVWLRWAFRSVEYAGVIRVESCYEDEEASG